MNPIVKAFRDRTRFQAEADHRVTRLGEQRQLIGPHRQRRQRALAHDHRVDELDRDVTSIGPVLRRRAGREQAAAGEKPLRQPQRQFRDPVGLAGEELGVRLRPRLDHAGTASLVAAPISQRRHSSTPAPVFALTRSRSTPGCTASRLCR